MKTFGIIAAVIILILIFAFTLFNTSQKPQMLVQPPAPSPATTGKIVGMKASFKIITNNTTRIFTDPKYHNRSEDVYIESSDPTVVHVTKVGITWDEFFKTLPSPMKVTKDCLTTGTGQLFCTNDVGSLKFYLNNKEDPDLLEKQIKDGDKALIEYI